MAYYAGPSKMPNIFAMVYYVYLDHQQIGIAFLEKQKNQWSSTRLKNGQMLGLG